MATYSHSKLDTYKTCPYKYKLRYIDRIVASEEGVEAFVGSRVHDVLERLYRGLQRGQEAHLQDALEHYEAEWEKNWHDGIKIVRAESQPDEYRRVGRQCIENYWKRYEPFDQAVVVGIERKVNIALDEAGSVRLVGYVDRLDRTGDGAYEIHDYKTGGSGLPEQAQVDADLQLAFYQMAVEQMWPDVRDVTLVWHYLAFDAELRSKRKPEALEELRRDALGLIEQVEAETKFPATESALCDWCGYQALCPMRKHMVTVAELEPEEFTADSGVRLVNRYVELTERRSEMVGEIDAEIDEVKQALVGFADSTGAQVVVGSDHKVTVKGERQLRIAAKGTEERARLEAKVRELGKWDEVTGLDSRALGSAIGAGRWDEATCKALEELVEWSEAHRLYKSRLREDRQRD